jgi:hypothetical protein
MNKKLLTAALLCLCTSAVLLAQIEKGAKMFGGGLGYANSYQELGRAYSVTSNAFNAQVGVFRFTSAQFGIGLDAGVGYDLSKVKDPTTPRDTATTKTSFSVTPSFGFFIPLRSERTYFTLLGSYTFKYGITNYVPGTGYPAFSNVVSFAPGLLYFINENIGLSAQLSLAAQANPMPQFAVRCLIPPKK